MEREKNLYRNVGMRNARLKVRDAGMQDAEALQERAPPLAGRLGRWVWIEKHCRVRLAIRRLGQVTGLVENQTRLEEEPDVVGKKNSVG